MLIGYGSVGRRHAGVLSARYKRLAIVDTARDARDDAKALYPDAAVCGDLKELGEAGWDWAASLAVIATLGPSHAGFFGDVVDLGTRYVVCEKPLASSAAAAAAMVDLAEQTGTALGVNLHLRYSGFVSGLTTVTQALGPPVTLVVNGGAIGLVTNGIHYLDLACELFDAGPISVISTATGEAINPRSTDLGFYGGTAVFSFQHGREAVLSFSNRSSVGPSITIYYATGMVVVNPDFTVRVLARDPVQLKKYPAVTRLGQPTEAVFSGPVPGIVSFQDRLNRLYDDVESGKPQVLSPATALRSLAAVIGALASGAAGNAVSLPLDPGSGPGRNEWPIS